MEIINIVGGKGGTGKTLVAICLGYALIRSGHKVLLIDADPGTDGLTHYLLGDIEPGELKNFRFKNTFLCMLDSIAEFIKKNPTIKFKGNDIDFNFDHAYISFNPLEVNREDDHGVSYQVITSDDRRMEDYPRNSRNSFAACSLTEEQFKTTVKIFFTILRRDYDEEYDYVIVDTRGGGSYQGTEICAASDSFIIVSESDRTSFYENQSLVDKINDSAGENKLLLRGIILNKTGKGDEYIIRQALAKEFKLEHKDIFLIPEDNEAINAYKGHKIPYLDSPGSNFSCATLNAFSKLMGLVKKKWDTVQVMKWNAFVREMDDAYKLRKKRDSHS